MAQQASISRKDLSFLGIDYWDRPVYEHRNGKLFKDITLKGTDKNIPDILNDVADNTFEGEPNNPYKVID